MFGRLRRLICMALILVLLIPAVTAYGETAAQGQGWLSGEASSLVQSRSVQSAADIPLANGHYERWIDRVADLPDYCWELYGWLEDNANAKGMLADPTMGEVVSGKYCHSVAVLSGSTDVVCDRTEYITKAKEAASAAMAEDFAEAKVYVGVVYDAFDRDHPEVFWLNGSGMYGYTGTYTYRYVKDRVLVDYEIEVLFYLQTSSFDVRYEQYRDPAAIASDIALRDRMVAEILSGCPKTGTEDQLLYLNRVLTERNAYNSAAAMGWSYAASESAWECLSALTGNAGIDGPVCEGYARAFMILCQKVGIPCVLVDGMVRAQVNQTPGGHMWNYVKIDGSWYGADVTWNDPFDPANPLDKASGYENELWLFLDSDTLVAPKLTFIESHQVENQVGSGGLQFTNGPLLNAQYWALMTSIDGMITSFGSGEEALLLEVYDPQSDKPILVQEYSGKKVEFSFDILKAEQYIIRVSKQDHVLRDYTITADEAATLNMKLCLVGDITGDGRVNIGDVAKIYAHARKTTLITDEYQLKCADVTGDSRVNVGDAARAYAKVKA